MIDDTREASNIEYSYSLSAEIIKISRFRTDRRAALEWARNLRFFAYDDSYDDGAQKQRKQECSRCYTRFKYHPIDQHDSLDPMLFHVCDKPFYNNHKLTTEEFKTHPMRFMCDVCNRGIWQGSRNHCGICLAGDFDMCDGCVASGKHCLDADHNLEQVPVFQIGECVHVNARSCGDCAKVPLFPNEGEATRFQIVQLENQEDTGGRYSNCDHFVAVSYCWPPSQYDTEGNFKQRKGRYSVRDQDGRTRPNRAPEDVITRAVVFAAQNGIRLIWIDQECIDQEDPADKELGIQVMDKVYQRAFLSIGLLRTRIESQDTLGALKHLLTNSSEFEGFSTVDIATPDLIEGLSTFFETIMNDSWHSRAWVLQEAFSAGPRMVLLLQHAPGIIIEGLPGISKTLSVSEIALHLDLFLMLIDYATGFLVKSLVTLPITDSLTQRRLSLLRQFRKFPPGDERSLESKWTHQAGVTRPRRSCNAAVALTYLQSRDNTHVPDRLAIVANLCNYDFRLNTIEVEKNHQHLGPCILALALVNGDFSLLCPEVYRDNEASEYESGFDQEEFSWLKIAPKRLQLLDARYLNSFAYYLPFLSVSENISKSGLSTLGYLWKVDRKIYLTQFQNETEKFNWFRARQVNFTFHVLRNPSYTSQTWRTTIIESPVIDDLDEEQKNALLDALASADEMSSEDNETFAENYRLHILKQLPEGLEGMFLRDTVSWFLRILYFLRQQEEIEVADAIWHSVRADNWSVSLSIAENRARGCFNSVAEFPPLDENGQIPIDISVAVDMFQLDWDRDGGLQQCWIIDSLFRDGYLSVGKFVRVSCNDEFNFHPEWLEELQPQLDEAALENVESTVATLGIGDATTDEEVEQDDTTSRIESAEGTLAVALSDENTLNTEILNEPFKLSDHADTQLFKQLMQSNFLSLLDDIPLQYETSTKSGASDIQDAQNEKNAQKLLATAMLYDQMASDWQIGGIEKLRNMRAVFDIRSKGERTTMILTPYDQRLERLPHAEVRAMSMSWIVEPTEECPDGKEGVREVFTTKERVKGMWKFMDRPYTEYMLV